MNLTLWAKDLNRFFVSNDPVNRIDPKGLRDYDGIDFGYDIFVSGENSVEYQEYQEDFINTTIEITQKFGKCTVTCSLDYATGGAITEASLATIKQASKTAFKLAKGVSKPLGIQSNIGLIKCLVECCE